ncbi:PREDICTED: uncharacterized protein LOC106817021 [Priapulus caudatus]|uniref:Uncharacterized protein LOC106817021 n=1 Tax=Priapulus caudatus TaxID=37621 RepID=A0ABM1EY81_PRICU|nr:PREDICTED: uncharacterized protein LOC106817021 [Priapulus caudatus]
MGGAFLAGLVYELLFDPKRNFKNTDDLLKESDRDALAAAAAKNVNYMRRSHSAQSHATVSTLMQPASATSTMQRLRTFERYGRDNIAYDAASVCPSNIELAEAMTPRGGTTGDLAADEDSRSGCHSSAYSSSSGVCV